MILCHIPVRASRGKLVRAEPIAALYEQEKVSMLVCSKNLKISFALTRQTVLNHLIDLML